MAHVVHPWRERCCKPTHNWLILVGVAVLKCGKGRDISCWSVQEPRSGCCGLYMYICHEEKHLFNYQPSHPGFICQLIMVKKSGTPFDCFHLLLYGMASLKGNWSLKHVWLWHEGDSHSCLQMPSLKSLFLRTKFGILKLAPVEKILSYMGETHLQAYWENRKMEYQLYPQHLMDVNSQRVWRIEYQDQ